MSFYKCSRRTFGQLLGAAALATAASGAASAQEVLADHLMERAVTDYVRYARPGNYRVVTEPTFTWIGSDLELLNNQVAVVYSKDIMNPKLIVFSHGALTEPLLYRYLLRHWVSHGYIVVAPVHDDSVIREGLTIRQQDVRGTASWDFSGLLNDHALWQERTQVCNLVLDSVPLLNNTFGLDINAERPIIAGHNYGAFTAQLLLGAKVNTQRGVALFRDPRWAGAILMSPQGAGIMGLYEESWVEISRPLIVMTGGRDVDESRQDAARKADIFWRSAPSFKHFAYMEYAAHTIFTGQSVRPGNYDERLFGDIKSVSTAFLKAYAEHDTTAYAHLLDDYFSAQTLEYPEGGSGFPRHSRLFMQSR